MEKELEEYIMLCAFYNMGDGFVATFDIDKEPIEGGLRFPDPRCRASRVLRECIVGPLGYEIDGSIMEMNLKEYTSDIEESLHMPFCTGGDLNPKRLLLAYSFGIFPWFDISDPSPWWWAPLSRFVLFPDEIHISHSMRTLLNKRKYRVTVNTAFKEVIEGCRTVNGRHVDPKGGWLGKDIVEAYTELWRQGYVKSVEVWDNETGKIAGGLYGVWINGCFMGESMFSYVPSGSKMAMIGLCEWMKGNGGKVIDLQIETEHLKSMGGRHISYMEYLRMLNPKAAEGKGDNLSDLRLDLTDKDKDAIDNNTLLDISFSKGNPIP